MKYVTIFEGYLPESRFCVQKDKVSRTIQDAIVDIPTLLQMYQGHLDDLFDKFNNGLVFESDAVGVFIDELSVDEVAAFELYKKELAAAEKAKADKEAAFAQWQSEMAAKAAASRSSVAPTEAPASVSSSEVPASE